MTYQELAREYRWRKAECATIASYAQWCGYPVTASEVGSQIAVWRDWYYAIRTDSQLEALTGVRKATSCEDGVYG